MLVVAPVWWIERRGARLPLRGLTAGALVAAIVGAPWYAAMAHVHGQAYLESFFIGDNLDRFATDRFNEPRPFWFYVPIVAGGMLPWTPLMACAVGPAIAWVRRKAPAGTTTLRLLLWATLPLLFFTISIGKQPRYVLPILPPLALLLARAVHRRLAAREEAPGRRDHLLRGSALLIGLLLAVLGALIYRAMPLIVMVDRRLVLAGAALIVLAGMGVAIGAYLLRRDRIPAAVAIAGALVLAGLQYALSPAGRDPVQDMAALVRTHHEGREPVATFRVFVRNLIFYTHMKQTDLPSDEALRSFLQRPERVLCVMTADELARVSASADLQVLTLAEVLYFNASAVKLRTLLSPDPARDLERVLLVTNR
jgi:4-amino-4-deoxy-L-arabinose transferase-like glycosyltransferase